MIFRRLVALSVTASLALFLAAASSGAAAASGPPKIQHVVIIVQEQRGLNELFQGYPGADTRPYGYDSRGARIPLQPLPLSSGIGLGSNSSAFVQAYDHGRMNGFDEVGDDCSVPPLASTRETLCRTLRGYSYVPAGEIEPYFAMAKQFVLADHTFASTYVGDFAVHQMLISGQDGLSAADPRQPDPGWGCDDGGNSGPQQPEFIESDAMRLLPPLAPSMPCFDYPTLGDELDAAKVSWRYYAPVYARSKPDLGYMWSAYDAIDHVRFGPDWNNVYSPSSQFIEDVKNGTLAGVTWITPSFAGSDHPRSQAGGGPDYVAGLINAVGQSQFWNSTAIFVVWTGSCGWYDYVPPPQIGHGSPGYGALGFRVPMLIISPYVPQGHVTHAQYEHGSILKFAEEVFGVPSLHGVDARAKSPAREFDFNQQPRPFTPIPLN